MRNFKVGVIAVVLALLLSACAAPGKTGWYDQWGACAAAGAAVGIAAGATDDFDTAMAAGAGGFVVGGAICAMGDTDKDGVKNYKDDCRGTVAGGIVDDRGCELDSDGDGIGDACDALTDSDGDGVADAMDNCANTPAGTEVDANGCAVAAENTPPTAVGDSATVAKGTGNSVAIRLTANDSDADGTINPNSITIVSQPNQATVRLHNDGSGYVTFTLDNKSGKNRSFSYTVQDDMGATSNTATVNVTVN